MIELFLAEDKPEPLRARIDALAQLVPYESVLIYEASEGSQPTLVPRLVRHPSLAAVIAQTTVRIGDGLTGRAPHRGEAIVMPDARLDERADHLHGTPHDGPREAMLVVPLTMRGELIDVAALERYGGNGFRRGQPCAPRPLRARGRRGVAVRLIETISGSG